MTKQTITWTVLPNGRTADLLNLTVHVAPRLVTDGPDATIEPSFPDWISWPDSLGEVTFGLALLDVLDANGQPTVVPATRVGTPPDKDHWKALFGGDTLVRGFAFKGYDHRAIHSFPVGLIVDFLADQYGRVGATSPLDFPAYADLADDDGFGPIGFEDVEDKVETGAERKVRLLKDLGNRIDTVSNNPGKWAIPYDPNGNATTDGRGESFLQLEGFHRRGLAVRNQPGPFLGRPDIPTFDFHDVVALTRDYPLLQRLMGLAIDLRVGSSRIFVGLPSPARVQLVINGFTPQTNTGNVRPITHCYLDAGRFEAAPADPNDTDLSGRQLRLGDANRFRLFEIDEDGAGLKARQFADNVTRSRRFGKKLSFVTPDSYSMPSLRSGGLAVARLGHAAQLAQSLAHQTALNQVAFTLTNDVTNNDPDVFAEDLTRGYRWDVLPAGGRGFASLMWRTGVYKLLDQGADGDVPVTEESATLSIPTTAGGPTDPPDLYQQETIVRWNGWSLGAHRPGRSLDVDDTLTRPENTAAANIPFEAHLDALGSSLPRLRFGQDYAMRARAVDLAGNSVRPDANASVDQISPTQTYVRFEPVEAPRALLRKPHTAGESNELVVVRSENAADNTFDSAERHIVPPRSSQHMAEQHGALDLPDGTIDKAAYNMLVDLDAGNLENHPDAQAEKDPNGSFFYDVDHLELNYLPDVLGRRAVIRDLPPTGGSTTAIVPFENLPKDWPNLETFRLLLTNDPADTWAVEQDGGHNLLKVTLDKGDQFDTLVSCQFDAADLGAFGIWGWIARWATTNGVDPAAAMDAALGGSHWMLTPSRTVTLLHAVRTPLLDPQLFSFEYVRHVGETFATFSRLIRMSRKSTAQIDVVGAWSMPIDTGDNPDPVSPQTFEGHAFTVPVERELPPGKGDPNLLEYQERHEYGDTKYRKISYHAIATSRFVEYFREELDQALVLGGMPVDPGVPFEPETVQLSNAVSGEQYLAATDGTDPATTDPAAGDYVVDTDSLTVQRLPNGRIPAGGAVTFSFVRPAIHTVSADSVRLINSSARPASPKVLYVVPTWTWAGHTRIGGGLRAYLDRPWWSSGDEERLGVVLWQGPTSILQNDPPTSLRPFVSMWGFDPVYKSQRVPLMPTADSFPLATALGTDLSIQEVSGALVDVAGHDVGFDFDRGLWYCDIQVADPNGAELKSYMPFVRLALARYQPNSLADCHLSKVVLADFAQLTPTRAASVTGVGASRTVTVSGRASVGTERGIEPAIMRVTIEKRMSNVQDDALAWQTIGNIRGIKKTVNLTPTTLDGNLVIWSGPVKVPTSGGQYRLLIEEVETFHDGGLNIKTGLTTQERVVFTDVFPLNAVGT